MNVFEKKLKKLENERKELEYNRKKLAELKEKYENNNSSVMEYLKLSKDPEVLDYLESKKEFDRIQGLMLLIELEMNNLEETMLFNKKYLHK